jgi:hypothetical protein
MAAEVWARAVFRFAGGRSRACPGFPRVCFSDAMQGQLIVPAVHWIAERYKPGERTRHTTEQDLETRCLPPSWKTFQSLSGKDVRSQP